MNIFSNMKSNWNAKISGYQALDSKDKKTFWKEALKADSLLLWIIMNSKPTYEGSQRIHPFISRFRAVRKSAAIIQIVL